MAQTADISVSIRKVLFLLATLLCVPAILLAQEDSIPCRFIYRMDIGARPSYVFQTTSFFEGENQKAKPIDTSFSGHLKFSSQFDPNSCPGRIYGGAYQGVGLAYFTFGNRQEVGNPIAFYLFQGARIKQFTPRLSLNYEWNLGISMGWEPYNYYNNDYNKAIGSRANAYINANFYLSWMLSQEFDLNTGIALTHFSNGNTKIPNAGLNTIGLQVGLAYYFNRENNMPSIRSSIPEFPRHISYDLTLFGSWRRRGVFFTDDHEISPDIYTVLGFSFAPMYNTGYRSRVGLSLDGVYDGSANLYSENGNDVKDCTPSFDKQIALGVSARAEYVMPYFTIGIGLGINVLHQGGDLDVFYQVLSLKTELTRNSYLHIGYNLQDFHDPSFLMLGIGYRFNNKRPAFHRKR